MESIYLISFSALFLGLGSWFGLGAKFLPRWFGLVLLALLAGYGWSVFAASAPLVYKMQILFRDLLFLGVFGAAFSRLAGWRWLFWLGFLLAAVALYFFTRTTLTTTWPYLAPLPLEEQGELLIELKVGASIADLADLEKRYQLKFKRAFDPKKTDQTLLDQYYLVDLPRGRRNLATIAAQLQASPAVIWTEENEMIQVEPLRNQPVPAKLPNKFGVNDPGLPNLWGFERMQVDAWYSMLRSMGKPRQRALIAILDTGVQGDHEDLRSNYRSTQASYDYDKKGHGTHCAGIAAAVSNNGLGIASLSLDQQLVQVTSIKVLSDNGYGTQETIIDGIIKAADQGAAVISLSLGGRSNQTRQRAYNQAVQYAQRAGAIVVAAAGNSNRSAAEFSPVNAKGVIGVSAVDSELNRAEFSNTVEELPWGVAAPGVGIYSTIPGNQYATYSGTSMATPYVAGLLGVLKAYRPDLTGAEAYNLLKTTGLATRNTAATGPFIQPAAALKKLPGR